MVVVVACAAAICPAGAATVATARAADTPTIVPRCATGRRFAAAWRRRWERSRDRSQRSSQLRSRRPGGSARIAHPSGACTALN